MNLKSITYLLTLVILSTLFAQCSKEDQPNQVGTWDARYTSRLFENDSLVSETVSNVEMVLKSNETGIVRGNTGEGTLEWDLVSSDTEINLIENYYLFSQGVFPQEVNHSTIYEILANEKKFQEWRYEFEYTLPDEIMRKSIRTWRLSR